ncbi:hypothetical protein C0J52_09531 [Blattella germanica]|nr:hypothetical protein C0J52_09531 [Blattella germanica]
MVALYTKSPHESRISLSSLIYVRYIRRKKSFFRIRGTTKNYFSILLKLLDRVFRYNREVNICIVIEIIAF